MSSSGTLHDKFSRIVALRPSRKNASAEIRVRETSLVENDAGEMARLTGATVQRNRYGEHLVIRRWYATPEQCLHAGDERAQQALSLLLSENAAAQKQNLKKRRPPCDAALAADPSQWLFLDTETTGLVGGSGTYAFLVGLAWWDSGGLQVEQLFMRDFGEEHSLLLALDERLAERRVLVTFNGKSFDWPLLETRFRMTRSISPRIPAAHLDFLHPARQLWRPRLSSVRLSELERHVLHVSPGSKLDWTRDGDMNSGDIPEAYFSFVRGGLCAPLVPVFQHNQMDLRGLAALAGHVLEILAGPQDAEAADDGQQSLDMYGLSRLLTQRGEHGRARKVCQAALTAGLPAEHDRAARRDLARFAKRAGDFPGAVELWESLAGVTARTRTKTRQHVARKSLARDQSRTLERILRRGAIAKPEIFLDESELRAALEACEQLAIHFEHRARAIDRAMQLTQRGITLLNHSQNIRERNVFNFGETVWQKWETRLSRRLERLDAKNNRITKKLGIELTTARD
ncbi:MAG TPA: ribonuclease H-like domain-containing protein [Candidatus Acidoferrales bacterium]